MKENWKKIPLPHKIVSTISILTSLAVIVLAVLQIFGILQTAGRIYVPLMGLRQPFCFFCISFSWRWS